MDVAVVVALLGLWAAILLPGLVRASRQGSPSTSVSRFHGSLVLLERTSTGSSDREAAPRQPAQGRVERRRRACARRRGIVGALLGGLLASLAAVPLLGVAAWTLAAVFASAGAAYVATWRWLVARRTLARRVAHLPERTVAAGGRGGDGEAVGSAASAGGERSWAAAAGGDPRWR